MTDLVDKGRECKYIYTEVLTDTVLAPGTCKDVSQTSLGTSNNAQRIGDRIEIESIELFYRLRGDDTTGQFYYSQVRLMLFQWYTDDGPYPPTPNNILQSGVRSFSPLNQDQMDNFGVLWDELLPVGKAQTSVATVDAFPASIPSFLSGRIKVKPIRKFIQYNPIGNPTGQNKIRFMYTCDGAIGVPVISYTVLLRYYDA